MTEAVATVQENKAPALVHQATGPMANALAALAAGVSVQDLRGLLDIQKDWEANEARKAYVADMAEFKRNPPSIKKTKLVEHSGISYHHATLNDANAPIIEALSLYGFSHDWKVTQANGNITVDCTITHRQGHSETTSFTAPPDNSGKKNAIQAIASSVTYMQRYTLLLATGLSSEEFQDDDGQGGQGLPPVNYDSEREVAHWIKLINECKHATGLKSVRVAANEYFVSVNDVAGWNKVKAAAVAKKAEFPEPAGAPA